MNESRTSGPHATPSERSPSDAGSPAAPIHIAFGVDAHYFRGMGVTIVSIIENNPALQFVFHVFAFSASEDSRRRLSELEARYHTSIRIHVLDPQVLDAFRGFPCFEHHSIGTFIRLLIPDRLAPFAEKVLYLDADLLCLGRIDDLLAVTLDDCVAAAVADQADTTVATQTHALGLAHPAYFNAGVMYIHTRNWQANDTQNKALTVLSSRTLRFADQDALNIVLNGQVKFVDDRWNFRYHLVTFLSKGIRQFHATERAIFMHFTGPVKPWHDWCLHEAKPMFLKYQSMSPWADVPLDRPRGARELKLFSKFLVKQHHVAAGVWWHLKYLAVRSRRLSKRQA